MEVKLRTGAYIYLFDILLYENIRFLKKLFVALSGFHYGGICMVIYIVKEGDSIFSIAESFGVPESLITSYNGLSARLDLFLGRQL